ncbi:hypothetical protein BJ165DRAFT_1078258 [Panaeolus papilionaceus]|nr:hypothetical protein BJ165DRAFT_1078258 [Panaeolus papilionaceus]
MSNTTPEMEFLKINGPLSVAPVRPEDVRGKFLWVYILMGPTGSGKSAKLFLFLQFIESLSPNQDLKISKDSLDSVTQNVTCYQVVNLTNTSKTWNFILMDTPGFLDTKLSESRITSMITEQLDSLCQSATNIHVMILYFQPITDIRMGGSKRDAVKLLRAFAESFKATGINLVTTMWNHMSRPQQIIDGNHRIISLEKEIFVSAKLGLRVHKFEFSRDSALSILENTYGGWSHYRNTSQNMDNQYQSLICNNLLDRISSAQQHLQFLAEDKKHATTPGKEDPCLLKVVLRDERAVLAALQSFLDDLVTFGATGLEALESLLDACYVNDPGSCSSPWPQPVILLGKSSIEVPNSPPSPSPSHNSFSARLKDFVSPLKKKFRKFKQ